MAFVGFVSVKEQKCIDEGHEIPRIPEIRIGQLLCFCELDGERSE